MDNEALIQQQTQKFIEQSQQEETQSNPEILESQSEISTQEQQSQAHEVKKEAIDPRTSFRELREKNKKLERDHQEAMKLLEQYRGQQNQPKTNENSSYSSKRLGDDDLVEGKHLNEFNQRYEKLYQEHEQLKQQTHQMNIRNRLYGKYSDFDKVVNEENLAMLGELEPEVASTLNSSQDSYSAAVTAYKAIKQAGIYKEDDMYSNDRKKIQENSNKPRPLSSVSPQTGDSPLARANAFANGLTEDLRKSLLKEMEEARKNR